MIEWKNLDQLESYKKLQGLKDQVELKSVMAGSNGAKRVAEYSVPMSNGMAYNFASKQVDDVVLEALQALADEAELDLVKVAPTAQPPVCRIVDYGKYKYEQLRKEKENKKKQHQVEIKEIRLSPNIDTNDLNTKVGAARKFLTKGDKVKVTLRFRGREMAHMNTTKHVFDDFAEALADVAVIDKPAKVEGRSMSLFLTAKK